MKPVFIALIALTLILPSCRKRSTATGPQAGTFIFGRSCGECMGNCATYYKIENGQLFENDNKNYTTDLNTLQFSHQLTQGKYDLVKNLQSHIPTQLYSYPDSTFGCPDCRDQCGYHLMLQDGNITYRWTIDPDLSSDPNSFLRLLAQEIEDDLAQLQ